MSTTYGDGRIGASFGFVAFAKHEGELLCLALYYGLQLRITISRASFGEVIFVICIFLRVYIGYVSIAFTIEADKWLLRGAFVDGRNVFSCFFLQVAVDDSRKLLISILLVETQSSLRPDLLKFDQDILVHLLACLLVGLVKHHEELLIALTEISAELHVKVARECCARKQTNPKQPVADIEG